MLMSLKLTLTLTAEPTDQICESCNGTGFDPDPGPEDNGDCVWCKGTGRELGVMDPKEVCQVLGLEPPPVEPT